MITSTKNEKVKYWKKLQTKKGRMKEGKFFIEGYHLVEEVVSSDWNVEELIFAEGTPIPDWGKSLPIQHVHGAVFNHLSQTKTPQGIAAVVHIREGREIVGAPLLLIDAIQDPGNLGTIIRTADAAGFSGIILGKGTVDVFNDKVIRSTQGSLFHIPIMQGDLEEAIPKLKAEGYSVWASALEGAEIYNSVSPDGKLALILGNEGSGIQKPLLKLADKIVKIPIYGKAESLNVSIAAGILMYYMKG